MPAAPPSLDALIEEALAPYRRLWPAHVVVAFRQELLVTLQTHPAARRLAAEANVNLDGSSGEVHVSGTTAQDEPARRARGAGTK